MKTAYAEGSRMDYPNLAAKVRRFLRGDLRRSGERTKVPVSFLYSWQIEDFMQNNRLSAVGFCVAVLLSAGLAQNVAQHLLSPEELNKVVPTEFFFAGQKAPTQLRNAAGFETAAGKFTFAALVDASGYSTAIQQKYQGMLITESKLSIGGAELPPGAYGFGFAADKFVVMNVANQDALDVPYQTDAAVKRAVPLKLAEDGSGYKLYAGKKWVAVKAE